MKRKYERGIEIHMLSPQWFTGTGYRLGLVRSQDIQTQKLCGMGIKNSTADQFVNRVDSLQDVVCLVVF